MGLRELLCKEIIKDFLGLYHKTKLKNNPFITIKSLKKYCNYVFKRETVNDLNNILITKKDINTLKDSFWLNDKIINFYFEMLVSEFNKKENEECYYTFSTYFFTKLIHGEKVSHWFDNINLSKYKLIFIPINTGNHWLLFCWDRMKSKLECYDSLYSIDKRMIFLVMNFLDFQFRKENYFTKMCYEVIDCAKQSNGSDCGVYCCMFGKSKLCEYFYKIRGNVCRMMMVHEIYVGKIIYKGNEEFE